MRNRSDAHQEALSRRLELLRAEIEADRQGGPDASPFVESAPDWWPDHAVVTDLARAAGPDPMGSDAVGSDAVGSDSVGSDSVGSDSEGPFERPERQVPVAVRVPVPGRHAARRSVPVPQLPDLVPEALRGRARLGPAQLTVVALGLAAALALTCWWLARGRATTIASPALASAAASPLVGLTPTGGGAPGAVVATAAAAAGAGPASGSASTGTMVTVDVEGKVRHPGIVVVPAGSRVTDALAAAGGVAGHRSLAGLNLAAVLVDGQQIVVGAPAGAPAGAAVGDSGGAPAAADAAGGGALVNLNTATAEELDTLPGVGPVTAQAILEWRQENGSFTSVQELLEVDGIGPKTLEQIAPRATV